ncbi:hypothetical protein D3C87_1422630 [compost metagenome]
MFRVVLNKPVYLHFGLGVIEVQPRYSHIILGCNLIVVARAEQLILRIQELAEFLPCSHVVGLCVIFEAVAKVCFRLRNTKRILGYYGRRAYTYKHADGGGAAFKNHRY